jgi:hypothetical protein
MASMTTDRTTAEGAGSRSALRPNVPEQIEQTDPRTVGTGVAGRAAHPIATVVLSWLAMVGVDFALHAGLLAPLYKWGSPFLLAPTDAFMRIPAGYVSMLVLAGALVWLLARLEVRGGRDGATVVAAFGAVVWGALVVGLWSISTADPGLLAGWWLGQTVELGVAGYVIGSLRSGIPVRSLAWRVAAFILLGAVSVVVLQVIGYATPRLVAN